MSELRIGECPCCEGSGIIITGSTPATWSDPPEAIEEPCQNCDGTGKALREVEDIEREDTLGVLAPRMGGYGHWHDWDDRSRFSDEWPHVKDMMPDVNWDVVTIRDGKMVLIPWGPEPFKPSRASAPYPIPNQRA